MRSPPAGAAPGPTTPWCLAPQSDGGPGFVDVLASRFGGLRRATTSGPLADPVTAEWVFDADSATAYVECAQACGLALLGGPPTVRTALDAHSKGVGQLVDAALAEGAERIVVGLGGSACTDGGRGMVDALGGLRRRPYPAGRRRVDRRHRRRTSAARPHGRPRRCSGRRRAPTRTPSKLLEARLDRMGR